MDPRLLAAALGFLAAALVLAWLLTRRPAVVPAGPPALSAEDVIAAAIRITREAAGDH